MRRATAAFVLLAVAATALAKDAPEAGVVLVVRPDAEGVRVDGVPTAPEVLRETALRRLGSSSPVGLALAASWNGSTLAVDVEATPKSAMPVDATLHVCLVEGGALVREAPAAAIDLASGPARRTHAFEQAPSGARAVAWVRAVDDPTGRFAAGEVLQAASVVSGTVHQERRGVLVESCTGCPAEASARAVAAELADASAAGAPRGYFRAPPAEEAALAAVAAGVALAVFWPRRGA